MRIPKAVHAIVARYADYPEEDRYQLIGKAISELVSTPAKVGRQKRSKFADALAAGTDELLRIHSEHLHQAEGKPLMKAEDRAVFIARAYGKATGLSPNTPPDSLARQVRDRAKRHKADRNG